MNAATASVALYMILQNISLGNESIESLIPKIVELSAWVLEIERCSVFLWDANKECLFLKSTTGKV